MWNDVHCARACKGKHHKYYDCNNILHTTIPLFPFKFHLRS